MLQVEEVAGLGCWSSVAGADKSDYMLQVEEVVVIPCWSSVAGLMV
jgi:hypothetical protein